jgi:hypothetical protein
MQQRKSAEGRSSPRVKRRQWAVILVLGVALSIALAPQAQAGFVDTYPLSQFGPVVNSPSPLFTNGFAVMSNGSIVLTGGNSGSGEPGTSDLLTSAVAGGLIQFQYSYSSLDMPHQDDAGYLLDGIFHELAFQDGQSGIAQFNVLANESFGFRVGTADNQFEPGVLTISSLASNVPEPGTGTIVMLVTGGLWAVRRVPSPHAPRSGRDA